MSHEEDRDEQLQGVLQQWKSPLPGDLLDARILASFHRRVSEGPWWKRLLAARLRVPAPAALAFAGAFIFLVVFSVSHSDLWSQIKRPLQDNRVQEPIPDEVSSSVMIPKGGSGAAKTEMDSALIHMRGVSSYITRLDLDGYQPLPRGTIKVERMDTRR